MVTKSAERLLKSAAAAVSAARRGFADEWHSADDERRDKYLASDAVRTGLDAYRERRECGEEPELDRPEFPADRIAALQQKLGS